MKQVVLFLLFVVASFSATAQKTQYKQPRVLVLLDGSSSMIQPWNKQQERYKVAAEIISRLMDSVYRMNDQVEFGLRVYGHQYPARDNNCFDTRNEVIFSKKNSVQMYLRVTSINPIGISPIAYSLQQAAEHDLVDEAHNAYTIILITDGGESCGGDICQVAKMLNERKIFFKPYIIGLVDYEPLIKQYECLGTYLQASDKDKLTTAVATIAAGYKQAFKKPIPVQPTASIAPPKKQEPVTPAPAPVVTAPPPPPPPPKPREQEEAPTADATRIKNSNAPSIRVASSNMATVTPPRTGQIPNFAKLPAITRIKPRTRLILLPSPTDEFMTVTPPPPPKIALYEPPAPTPPPPAPVPKPVPPAPKPKPATPPPTANTKSGQELINAPFTTETVTAEKTTLSVFFTDGKGKFYSATPQMQLYDHATGKPVKDFYRTTDAVGNPDPVELAAGTYDIGYKGKPYILSSNISIVANNNNKITIIVTKGSIHFYYAPDKERPVKEFNARVTRRFERVNPTVEQGCEEILPYEAGNYYIEVNTLPITRYNADVLFGARTELAVREPGFVHFTNQNNVGKVELYHPLGNKYVHFHDIMVSGTPANQTLKLQPMMYEAHYIKDPKLPYASAKVVKFLVKSNETIEVDLP